MLCPSCSAAALDAYGRCPHCGYSAAPPAPSYAAYYPQPALVTPTAPAGIGLAAQILIAVCGLIAVVAFGTDLWAYSSAQHSLDTGTYTDPLARAALASAFNGIGSLLDLAAGVVFIIWFYKSAALARILAPGQQALAPGWAVGGWFIPLAYWVLPRIVAGGIWRAAIPLGAEPTGRKPRTHLVTWWWLTFIVGQQLLAFSVGNIAVDSYSTSGGLAFVFGLGGVVGLCRIASAVLGIIMIRKLTSMQQIRILQGPGTGHPYAAPTAPLGVPYAAYADPSAAYGYPGTVPAPAPMPGYVPAPTQPQDAPPAPATYQASVPPQAPVPVPTQVAPVETAPTQVAQPEDAAPQDAVPVEVPTAVIPRQAEEHSTVILTPVPAQRDGDSDSPLPEPTVPTSATDADASTPTENGPKDA
ncbi:hypothetical protein ABH931_007401 [Streptacidiphilus sp. MAP12-33]|uniref:DUF4328 domain-containing protein n=1 Tax=Streptacidiphilus sp. MAP12-33 TaxID=3156266 RepID=UPI00351965FA